MRKTIKPLHNICHYCKTRFEVGSQIYLSHDLSFCSEEHRYYYMRKKLATNTLTKPKINEIKHTSSYSSSLDSLEDTKDTKDTESFYEKEVNICRTCCIN